MEATWLINSCTGSGVALRAALVNEFPLRSCIQVLQGRKIVVYDLARFAIEFFESPHDTITTLDLETEKVRKT